MATAETTEAQSEAEQTLRDAQPLSRDSLTDESIVRALWSEADRVKGVSQTLFGVVEVYRSFDHSPAFRYEIATALDEFGIHDVPAKRTSDAFRSQIRLANSDGRKTAEDWTA